MPSFYLVYGSDNCKSYTENILNLKMYAASVYDLCRYGWNLRVHSFERKTNDVTVPRTRASLYTSFHDDRLNDFGDWLEEIYIRAHNLLCCVIYSIHDPFMLTV